MANEKILVVDDEESMCDFLSIMLKKQGYQITTALSAKEGLKKLAKEAYEVVISDLKMKEMNGLELIDEINKKETVPTVIIMTAFATIESAIEALKKGAFDYIIKPFKVDEIKLAVARALEQRKIRTENVYLKKQLKKKEGFGEIIGKSEILMEVLSQVRKIADSDSTVLLTGESGTGKELVARAIHQQSYRSEKPFITVNCGALPEGLLESELFGHIKGSFTGAIKDKDGLFKVASEGVFFLDEVGEMSPRIQVKLLRVLQEKEIVPVGGTSPIKVDIRLIAATNADLENEVSMGRFRKDLFYRLNVIPINIPPLRERKEDIPLLIDYFLKRYGQEPDGQEKKISAEAKKILCNHNWPGNIRELENILERAVTLQDDNTIVEKDLPEKIIKGQGRVLAKTKELENPTLETIEKAYIFWILRESGWQKQRAAEILGIDPSTLYRKIEKYELKDIK
ncbi:sigma-54-dependent Fis family transcriptional regulator [bacterium]|nr:sigma-54-dependent Fis family transcriptional regulator [bacterium]